MASKVSQIDHEITAIHKVIRKLERIDLYSAASWQAAWDKHPELRERETELFRRRGFAQLERDEKAAKIALAAARKARYRRPRKCPTCGQHSIAA